MNKTNMATDSTFIGNAWIRIPYNIRATFLSGVIIGILTHGFALTNKLLNHDGVIAQVGERTITLWGARGGRWFGSVLSPLTSRFSMPLVNGLLFIFVLSIAACIVVSVLRIKKPAYCVLVAGLMVTFPTVTGFMTFMAGAEVPGIGIVLACFTVYLAEKYRYGYLIAIIPITLAMAIYQAFFGIAAGLMILVLIAEILRNKTTWSKTFIKGIKYFGALAGGMVLYFISVWITTQITTIPLMTYMGVNEMGNVSRHQVPGMVFEAYESIIRFFVQDFRNFHSFTIVPRLTVVAFVLTAVLTVWLCIRKRMHKEPLKLVLLAALLIIFPLGCNIIYLFGAWLVHDLMIYPTVLVLILVVVILDLHLQEQSNENKEHEKNVHQDEHKKSRPVGAVTRRLFAGIISLTIALNIYSYWITANQAYNLLFFTYERTYAQSVILVTKIQSTEGFTTDTEIVFVGLPMRDEELVSGFEDITIHGAFHMYEMFVWWSYPTFLSYFLMFNNEIIDTLWQMHWPSREPVYEIDEVIEDPLLVAKILEMPLYPDYGSIKMIDGVIYVRFN